MQGLNATPTACCLFACPEKRRTQRDALKSQSLTHPPSESAADDAKSSYASLGCEQYLDPLAKANVCTGLLWASSHLRTHRPAPTSSTSTQRLDPAVTAT